MQALLRRCRGQQIERQRVLKTKPIVRWDFLGVNMPLLYGEGEDASLRLQGSILGRTVDDSIFAWNYAGENDGGLGLLLATSPDFFKSSGYIATVPQEYFRQDFVINADPVPGQYPLTDMGLEIQAALNKVKHFYANDLF